MLDRIKVVFPPSSQCMEVLKKAQPEAEKAEEKQLITGKIAGFNVRASHQQTEMSGSVTKAILGHNRDNVTCQEVFRQLSSFCEESGLPPYSGLLRSIEIGFTFATRLAPDEYLVQIEGLQRHRLSVFRFSGHGRYLSNTRRSLVLYDKGAENISRRGLPDDDFLLRYELRLKKGISKELGLSAPMTVETLMNPLLCKSMLDKWHDLFTQIRFAPTSVVFPEVLNGSKSVKEALMAMGVAACGGVNPLNDVLACRSRSGELTPNASWALRRDISRVVSKYGDKSSDCLVDELRGLVTNQYRDTVAELERLQAIQPTIPPRSIIAPRHTNEVQDV